MTQIFGGHGLGLADGSLNQLARRDIAGAASLGSGVDSYLNAANGNLVLQARDAFMPSLGEDFDLVRTYNARGVVAGVSDGWSWSTSIRLVTHEDLSPKGAAVTNHVVTLGDGTALHFDFDAASGEWQSTDGAGAYQRLRAVNGDPVLRYLLVRSDQSQVGFDAAGRAVRITDTHGVTTELVHDEAGRLVAVVDDTSHRIAYRHDAAGRLVAVVTQDPGQPEVQLAAYRYVDGRLVEAEDRAGHVTRYAYDANGLLVSLQLPSQQQVDGVLQRYDTREIAFTYRQANWGDDTHEPGPFDGPTAWVLTSVTDALGAVTRFQYDFGFRTSMAVGDRDRHYRVDGGDRFFVGGTTSVIDALGRTTRYTVDADGYLTAVVDADGYETRYVWGARDAQQKPSVRHQDNLLAVTDRNGWAAVRSDDAPWRALRRDLGVVDLAGNGKLVADLTEADRALLLERHTTRYTYDQRGNRVSETDGLGQRTTWTYTLFNQVASMTSAMGHALATSDAPDVQARRVELGYPPALASLTPAQAEALRALYTTFYEYDERQALVRRTDPGGDTTFYKYDDAGNLIRVIETWRDAADVADAARTRVTSLAYDAWGNVSSIVDPGGNRITQTHDAWGNLLTRRDARGGLTRFAYDADNRLLSETDPEGHTTVYRYDAVGNRIAIVDAAGKTVTQVFDRNNQLIVVIDPAASAALTRTTGYTYDVVGNRTRSTDAEGRVTDYLYDARRQLVEVRQPAVPGVDGTPVRYSTFYAYDGEGRVISTTDARGGVTQTAYTVDGLVRRITDAAGNVTEMRHDANGNRIEVIVGAQLAPAARRVLRFGYDEEDQLVREVDALGGVTTTARDAVGNVQSVTDARGNRTDYTYDKNDRLLTETRPALPGQATRYTVQHRYDANGNEVETTDENNLVTRYTFDRDDNLVMVSDPNGVETVYRYDSRHNRTMVAIGVQARVGADGKPVIDDASLGRVVTYTYDEFNQVVATTDGVGNALVGSDAALYRQMRRDYGYAENVVDLSADDRRALLARYTELDAYDRAGNLVREQDHLGRVTTHAYDALDRRVATTEAVGTAVQRSTSRVLDGNGNVVSETDALSRTTTSTFDAMDRLVALVDAAGVTTRTERDAFGNVTAQVRNAGEDDARRTTYEYDLNARLLREVDPLGGETRYAYDAVGNRVSVLDASRGLVREFYDAMNRRIRVTDARGFQTRFEYDGVGNQVALIDPRGGVQRVTFDGANRVVRTVDAVGNVTLLEHDPLGQVVTRTTAAGTDDEQVTRYVYDAEGHLRSTTDAAGNVSTTRYDDAYQQTSVTDGNGNTTTYGWDALGRQLRVTNPLGQSTSYTYDAADNRLTETDALGRVRVLRYDALDRVVVDADAAGVETRYAYDAFGDRLTVTRAANTPQAAATQYAYDANGRLVKETDALGGESVRTYDEVGRVLSVTDANGHTTSYLYDNGDDKVTGIIDALGGLTEYLYDAAGNRMLVVDALGRRTVSYFDLAGRMTAMVDAGGYVTTRRYDGNGNLVAETLFMTPVTLPVDLVVPPTPAASPLDRTTLYAYDAVNRLVSTTDPTGAVTSTTYDAAGQVLTQVDARGGTTSYGYDAAGRVTSVVDAGGALTAYAYDAVGNRTLQVDTAGRPTQYRYDALNRLTSITDALNQVTRYAHDAVGNRLRATDPRGGVYRYAYDALDRLTTATDEAGTVYGYTYDAVGNRLTETVGQGRPEAATTSWTYDALNREATRTDALGFTTAYGHDAVGNRTSVTDPKRGVTTITYDALDQVSGGVDAGNFRTTRETDGAGNVVSETDERGGRTLKFYDGADRLIFTVDALGFAERREYDASGNLVLSRRYANKAGAVTQPGVPPAVTESAQDRIRTYEYDAMNRLVVEVDGEGYATTYVHDRLGNVVGVQRQVDLDDPGQDLIERRWYDDLNRLVATLSPGGRLSTMAYDGAGHMVRRTDHDGLYEAPANGSAPTPLSGDAGRVTTRTVDGRGRVLSETNAVGVVTRYAYDARGNQVGMIEAADTPQARTTTTVFDLVGQVLSVTDPLGVETLYAYDSRGNVETRFDGARLPEVRLTRFSYNALNQLVEMIDAAGVRTLYQYDAFGNKTGQVVAAGRAEQRTESFEYDANNRLVAQVNGAGNRTEFDFDAFGNQVFTEVAPGTTVTRGHLSVFDRNDRLSLEVDNNGLVTRHVHDGAGRRIAIVQAPDLPEARTSRYAYDRDGNLVAVTDPEGGVARFEFDAMGNQTRIVTAGGRETRNVYDAAGRLVQSTAGVGLGARAVRTVNAYDAFDNLVSSTQSFADGSDARVTTYAFDARDRQTLVTDGEGFSTRMTYDGVGNMVLLESGLYLIAPGGAGYDAGRAARAKPVVLAFTHDRMGRLLTTTNAMGGVVAATYDGVGNRLTQTTRTGNNGEVRTVTSSYDKANRLVLRLTPEGGRDELVYDAAGNQIEQRTLREGTADLGQFVITTYTHDRLGRVLDETGPRGVVTRHLYDRFGNEVRTVIGFGRADARTLRYEFDRNNRLVAQTDAAGARTTYLLDADGNRLRETDALGRSTWLYHDELGRQVGTLDPERYYTAFVRDAMGNIVESRMFADAIARRDDDRVPPQPADSAARRTVTASFDRVGNLVEQTGAGGDLVRYAYSSTRRLVRQTTVGTSNAADVARTLDKLARVQTFEYDAADRLSVYTGVDGRVERYRYDSANNKIEELIQFLGDPDRRTVYTYDRDNRMVSQVFDPAGLRLTESLGHDLMGNVISKLDANRNESRLVYDLDGNLVRVKNALGEEILYSWDAYGNRIAVVDARGGRTDFTYDGMGRVLTETGPEVSVHDPVTDTFSLKRPVKTTRYDAVGNIVQLVDANGNVTTRWYDGNDRMVAELTGDQSLRTSTYNAWDDQVSVTQYMRRLAGGHVIGTPPKPPGGEARTIRYELDDGGRVLRVVYPEVDVTTVANAATAPVATVSRVQPTEERRYDRFGNLVESFDRNGARSLAYHDRAGNVVMTVDAAGYVTYFAYDGQGKLIQQARFVNPLPLSGAGAAVAGTLPGFPAGDREQIIRSHDAAGRLVSETSPTVQTATGPARMRTDFVYDANGNEVRRELGAGSGASRIQYSWYDALNRRVASVDSARGLVEYAYDANGNLTQVARRFNAVPASVVLGTASLQTLLASVAADPTRDEVRTQSYDAMNRQVEQRDLMGAGSADDIVLTTGRDAQGNVTRRTDALGFVSVSRYNGVNLIAQTTTPDNNTTYFEYDTGGLRTRSFTGDLLGVGVAVPASNVQADADAATLRISYDVSRPGLTSYVAYDTVPRNRVIDYRNRTPTTGAGAQLGAIPLAEYPPGTTVYVRIVTEDVFGSQAWTDERAVLVPARVASLEAALVDADTATVAVSFDAGITDAVLLAGPRGAPPTGTYALALSGGRYVATVEGGGQDLQGWAYQVRYTFGGTTYTSEVQPFEATGVHGATADGLKLTWPVPSGAAGTAAPDGQVMVIDGLRVDGATRDASGALVVPTPTPTTTEPHLWSVFYGDLVPSTHTTSVSYGTLQRTTVLSDTRETSGGVTTSRTIELGWFQAGMVATVSTTLGADEALRVSAGSMRLSWRLAGQGDVFSDSAPVSRSGNTFIGQPVLAPGLFDVKLAYIDTVTGKEVIVDWLRLDVPAPADLPESISITDDTGPNFDFDGQFVSSGGLSSAYPFSLQRLVAQGGFSTTPSNSVVVHASERGGTFVTDEAGRVVAVDPGFYSGPLAPSQGTVNVATKVTASAPAGARAPGVASSPIYQIEQEYNALGVLVATNEGTGLWRRLGVDGVGRAVQTQVYGTRAAEAAGQAPITTYAGYDGRGLRTLEVGAEVLIDPSNVGGDTARGRLITRMGYDYAGRLVLSSRLRAAGGSIDRAYTYDLVGNLTSEATNDGIVTRVYTLFGEEARRTDGENRSVTKTYDGAGRLVSERDGTNVGDDYGRDTFGRVTSVTNRLGHRTTFSYDQADRMVSVTDALGGSTRYVYSARGERVFTVDANGNWFGSRFDAMGRTISTFSFQGGQPASQFDAARAVSFSTGPAAAWLVIKRFRYDVFGNKVGETDANGQTRTYRYGAYGRLEQLVDEEGRTFNYTNDRFGRVVAETGSNGRNIVRTYDDANRLKFVNDVATGVSTFYTYDELNRRATEQVFGPATRLRTVSYAYDSRDRMVQWSEQITGLSLTYGYDRAGNVIQVNGSNGVDNRYTYDNANRLLTIRRGSPGTLQVQYTYDLAGNRKTSFDGSTTVTYTYDALQRVTRSDATGGSFATWVYDKVGNLTLYEEFKSATVKAYARANTYNESNRLTQTVIDDTRDADAAKHARSTTVNTLDKAGRTLTEVVTDRKNVSTTTYTHVYTRDGRELSVTATGGSLGSSTATYDTNDRLSKLDLGKRSGLDTNELKTFVFNNDGQILTRTLDDGLNATANPVTRYLYALGQAVGETGTTASGSTLTVLDSGNYSPVEQIGPEFPSASVSSYEVRSGDTLRSIAASVYGNPSLWYLIAEANGLSGDSALVAGTALKIPNRVELGRLTSETHAVYSESDIVGSRLPNLNAPPPSEQEKCGAIAAIIAVVALAIIGAILIGVTAGLATPVVAAALGLAGSTLGLVITGVLVGAVIGAAISFATSALSQVILVAAKVQKEFDWTQVLADTAVGFISGGLAGVGALIEVGAVAGRVAKVAAVVASVALEAAGEAARQAIVNPDHRPDNPLAIVLAGVGGGFGMAASVVVRAVNLRAASKVVGLLSKSATRDGVKVSTKYAVPLTVRRLQDGSKIVRVVENGQVIFKQVSKVTQAGKVVQSVSKTLDVAADVGSTAAKYPAKALQVILDDVNAAKQLTRGQRAVQAATDVFGAGAVGKVQKAAGDVAEFGRVLVASADGALSRAGQSAGEAVSKALAPAGKLLDDAAFTARVLAGLAPEGLRNAAKSIAAAAVRADAALVKASRNLDEAADGLGLVIKGLAQDAGTLLSEAGSSVRTSVRSAARSVQRGVDRRVAAGQNLISSYFDVLSGETSTRIATRALAIASVPFAAVAAVAVGVPGLALYGVGYVAKALGDKVADAVPRALLLKSEFLNVAAKVGGTVIGQARSAVNRDGEPGRRRAVYFRSDEGVVFSTVRAENGTQGPVDGVGGRVSAVLNGERPFRPQFQAPTWENNAGPTTLSVYSGAPADRGIDLRTFNALNLLRLGRVAAMDQATRDDFAASVVANVVQPRLNVPLTFLDPSVPDPRPVFAG